MPGRVLIVDDDVHILDLLRGYLARAGWSVHTTASALGLESSIASTRPDVVLCDLCIPDRDAVEFLLDRAALTAESIVSETPVVIISGHELVNDAIDVEWDVAAVLHKPLVLPEVQRTLEAVVSKREE